MKDLSMFDLKIELHAKYHPQGHVPRFRIFHPGQNVRKNDLISFVLNWFINDVSNTPRP